MKLGDLVEHEGKRWVVLSYDRVLRLNLLLDQAGIRKEVPDEAPDATVIANPTLEWPTLTAAIKPGAGPFVKLAVPGLPGNQERVLTPWVDWVQSNPGRDGGSLFVNPAARLNPGMVLIATHRNGALVRVSVPRNYGTVAQRRARAAIQNPPPPTEPVNRFNRILDDEDE
jgi:hypothetical protein